MNQARAILWAHLRTAKKCIRALEGVSLRTCSGRSGLVRFLQLLAAVATARLAAANPAMTSG